MVLHDRIIYKGNRVILPILLAVALLPVPAISQTREPDFERYTLDDGLSNNVVTAFAQDRFGFIWIGTEDGLNRFDGYSFTVFKHDLHVPSSIVSNDVHALCTDSAGNFWVGTNGGLDRFDPASGGFVHFDHDSDTTFAIGGVGRYVVIDRAGILWAMPGPDTLIRYDPVRRSVRRYPTGIAASAGREIVSFYASSDGRVIFSLSDARIIAFDAATGAFSDFHSPLNQTPTSINEDRNGNFWFTTFGFGIGRLNPRDGSYTSFVHAAGKPESLADNFCGPIYVDTHGRVWVATFGCGIDRLNSDGQTFTHIRYNPNDPLSIGNARVYALFEDRRGSIWVGTWQGGVSVYHPWKRKFLNLRHIPGDPRTLNSDTVWALAPDREGMLWVGTETGGLSRYDPRSNGFMHYQHDPRNPRSIGSNYVIGVKEDHSGRVWISLYGAGLDRFDPARREFLHYRHDPKNPLSLASDRATRVLEDHDHFIWVGSTDGILSRLDPATGQFTRYRIPDSSGRGFVADETEALAEDHKGNLWIGTFGSGLFKLNPERTGFTAYHQTPGVLSLAVDANDDVWIGTFALGLLRYHAAADSFEVFTERDGLPSNFIKGIVPDNRGNVWISSNRGLAKLSSANRAFRSYDLTDGVQANEFRSGAFCREADGTICFGGIRGFNMFHPDSLRDNPNAPPVRITAFRVFDQPVQLSGPITDIDEIDLSYAQDFFSFEFVALDYSASRKNQYAYKLEGFDRDWVMCGTRRFASYTHLNGGTYVFRVRGSNNDGIWNVEGDSIRLVIHPPFWDTWWFRIGAAALIAGVPFLLYRGRYRRLLAVELTRTRIARDLHDELSATLSGINFFAEAIARDGENTMTRSSSRFLSLIRESASALQESVGDIIWSVNPGQDHWEQIVAKLRRYGSDVLDSKSIAYTFDLPEKLPAFTLSMDRRRAMWLMYKEIVTNAAKHSGAKHVSITLRISSDHLADLVVKDDGRGFDPDASTNGNGLKNIRSRADSIGATAAVTSTPGGGTAWTVRFPV